MLDDVKVLSQLGMPAPNRPIAQCTTHLIKSCNVREKLYNLDALRELLRVNIPLLNPQQKYVFDTLMKIVNDGTGGIYF